MPRPRPTQVLFSAPSPVAGAMGLNLLGMGHHTTQTKRPFPGMKPWALPYWSFNWVSKGGGWFENTPAGRLRVRAGDIVLRFPNEPCRYGPTPPGTWHDYWFLFDGEWPRRLAESGLILPSHPIIHAPGGDFQKRFAATWLESLAKKPHLDTIAKLLVDVLFVCSRQNHRGRKGPGQKPDALMLFYDLLLKQVGEPAEHLPALAGPLGNYHSLRRAFQMRYGQSPHRVLMEFKMLTARRLLLTTPKSLAEISAAVGLEDPSYFIRLFRRRFGLAPVKFRRNLNEGL